MPFTGIQLRNAPAGHQAIQPPAPARTEAAQPSRRRSLGNDYLRRTADPPAVADPGGPRRSLLLGSAYDPLEREADTLADRATDSAAAHGPRCRPAAPAGGTPAPDGAVAGLDALRGGGSPLSARDQAYYGDRLGHDLSRVRVHTGPGAIGVAAALQAAALTVGNDVVLGPAAAAGGAPGRRVLAHELAHVVQQRVSPGRPWIQRQPTAGPRTLADLLKAGDDITVVVYSRTTGGTPEPGYSRRYHLGATGEIVIADGRTTVAIGLAGLSAHDAAQRIADRLVDAELFRGPRVGVTGPGMADPAYADAKTAMRPQTATAYENFLAYIRGTREPVDAVARYYQWVGDHAGSPELFTISPPELWARSLRPPQRPSDPEAERWLRFMKARQLEDAKLAAPDRAHAVEAMARFLVWYERHQGDRDFAKADPAEVYADISVGLIKQDIAASSRHRLEATKEAATTSPEALAAKGAKFDEFFALGRRLWGYSARTFPYSIPVDSRGQDILVTGDPALQHVLDALARELVHWATTHMSDANYATVSSKQVLLDLLQSGYSAKIADAQHTPVAHETIDRNEILAKTALGAFAETVAIGLFAVAVVGLFVGANVITAGGATVILAGLAGYSGITSYLDRREEIEGSPYQVPVAETMLDAAGDAVGVSQLVEGITGERLGTGAKLGSVARSGQLGAGTGNLATLLAGSRAYRSAQRVGQTGRLSLPGLKPPRPGVPVRPVLPRPVLPGPNPARGPVESAARAALPEGLRPGLDLWSAEIRTNRANPENVLRQKPEKILEQAEKFLERHNEAVAAADRSVREAVRATDDPFHPMSKNVRTIPGSKVSIHYDSKTPTLREIAQAVDLSKRTGEEIRLFGDDYPGIDGTIGDPPRPLQIKNAVKQAHPNLARKMAGDALQEAKDAGYTHVEVHIDLPGSKIAEIQAAWDGPPPRASDPIPGPAFEESVVAKIVVHGADGAWTLQPPLTGRPLTGVTPVPPRPDPEDRTK
ncbi:MAG: hypothetical protein QOI78_817 [Actinomycetota bacterium]|nr:hypothetical protein [Actinomycetota bacterium]